MKSCIKILGNYILDKPIDINRPSAPTNGVSLAAATERRAKSIREVVNYLSYKLSTENVKTSYEVEFKPRRNKINYLNNVDYAARAAWAIVNMWLLAHADDCRYGIIEAERQFLDPVTLPVKHLTALLSKNDIDYTNQLLQKINIDFEFWDLYPYILDEHGPGSRDSVLRDPSTQGARTKKRENGVFYTPSDVADYMVSQVFSNYSGSIYNSKYIDPACGTGVFLLSIINYIKKLKHKNIFDFVTNCLFGCDLNGLALDSCAFVLLKSCLHHINKKEISLWKAWHLIRSNLVEIDTVILQRDATTHLQTLFPSIEGGFNILVGNPPYTKLGDRDDLNILSNTYECFSRKEPTSNDNLYILFIEFMWKLVSPRESASSLVTPLSISYHSGSQYVACREAIIKSGGKWHFAFFDREPHALFGEEVKTRNAILFRYNNDSFIERQTELYTTPLLKWTSRSRERLFDRIKYTRLQHPCISERIPKLGSKRQVKAYEQITSLKEDNMYYWSISKCKQAFALNPRVGLVFIGGTAYNFLNIYRFIPNHDGLTLDTLSNSPVHVLKCSSEEDAYMTLSLFSSRLTYWLWRISGDGFHVSQNFIKGMPFKKSRFTNGEYKDLVKLGVDLWEELQKHMFVSLNRGSKTVGFKILASKKERDAIDSVLIKHFGLGSDFLTELKHYEHTTSVVDSNNPVCNDLNDYI